MSVMATDLADSVPDRIDSIFKYEPLKERDSIRLLHLDNAAKASDPLHCELISINLSNLQTQELDFTAISYTWGDVSQPRQSFIGTKVLAIGSNLYNALFSCRLTDKPIILWADGGCINQTDLAERAQQVTLMREIYSAAQTTICYIGSGDVSFTSRSAWNYLQRESSWMKMSNPQVHKQLADAIDFRGNLDDVEDDILGRAWFRRAWVLQEVVVSRWLMLQSGQRRIPWDDFCKTLLNSPRVHDRYGMSLRKRDLYDYVRNQFICRCVFQASIRNAARLPVWYKSIQRGHDGEVDILAYSRRLNASDPRDKIYAILAINPQQDYANFQVDYIQEREAVYREFARYCVTTIGKFDILSHVDTSIVLRLDSWVPNWMQLPSVSRSILGILPIEHVEKQSRRKAHVRVSQSWDQQYPLCFTCQGEVIGTITWKSRSIQLKGAHEESFEKLRDEFGNDELELHAHVLSNWEMFGYGLTELQEMAPEGNAGLPSSSGVHVMSAMPLRTAWPHLAGYQRVDSNLAEQATQEESESESESDSGDETDAGGVPMAERDLSRLHSYEPAQAKDKILPFASNANATPPEEDYHKPFNELGILEQHLLHRSRKTIEFTSDTGSKSTDIIIDPSSIIDQRCFAKFSVPDPSEVHVALVPPVSEVGDLIIAIHVARVPFVVREITDDAGLQDEECDRVFAGLPARRHFMFVGECLFNDFEAWDVVEDADDAMPRYSENFVFR